MREAYEGVAIGGELEGQTIKHYIPVYRHPVKERITCVQPSPTVPPSQDPLYVEDYRYMQIQFGKEVYDLWVLSTIAPRDIFGHMLRQLAAWSRLIRAGQISAWDIYEDVLRRTT